MLLTREVSKKMSDPNDPGGIPDIDETAVGALMAGQSDDLSTDDVFKIPEGMLSAEEANEMLLWMSGKITEPPVAIRKSMYTVTLKLQSILALAVIESFGGIRHQLNYAKEAEKILFDVDQLMTDDREVKMQKYADCMKSMMMKLEFARKFAFQSKDFNLESSMGAEKLSAKIMNLPPDKISKIIDIIEKGSI